MVGCWRQKREETHPLAPAQQPYLVAVLMFIFFLNGISVPNPFSFLSTSLWLSSIITDVPLGTEWICSRCSVMGEAVIVTCLVAGDLCMFERKIDLWRIDEARQQKRERDIRPVRLSSEPAAAMCSGRQGFHGNTGKTIDHALTLESLSSALGVFPTEVWAVRRLSFTSRLKCTS